MSDNNWHEHDDPKVMDVNRPGKGRVMISSSRPVVSPIAGDKVEDSDIKVSQPARKLSIKPINDLSTEDDPVSSDNDHSSRGSNETSGSETSPALDPVTSQPSEEDKPDRSESIDDIPSSSAEVDALAEDSVKKREAKQKEAEEQKKQEELAALIASGEYHVPVGSSSDSRVMKLIIATVVIIVAVLAAVFVYLV